MRDTVSRVDCTITASSDHTGSGRMIPSAAARDWRSSSAAIRPVAESSAVSSMRWRIAAIRADKCRAMASATNG